MFDRKSSIQRVQSKGKLIRSCEIILAMSVSRPNSTYETVKAALEKDD